MNIPIDQVSQSATTTWKMGFAHLNQRASLIIPSLILPQNPMVFSSPVGLHNRSSGYGDIADPNVMPRLISTETWDAISEISKAMKVMFLLYSIENPRRVDCWYGVKVKISS